MKAMQLRTEFTQAKSALQIFDLAEAEVEAVSGGLRMLDSARPYARSNDMIENGTAGYYQIWEFDYSDGSTDYKTYWVSYV